MTKTRSGHGRVLVLGWLIASCGLACSNERSSDAILAEIHSIAPPPRPPDSTDRSVVAAFAAKARKAQEARSDLIGELFQVDPEKPELAVLLPSRWQVLIGKPEELSTLRKEADWAATNGKDERLVAEAYLFKALAVLRASDGDSKKTKGSLADIEEFGRRSPKDPRMPVLLYTYASKLEDLNDKEEVFQRIEREFPNTGAAREVVSARAKLAGERHKLELVGKPFQLEFADAIKGTPVSMAALKGRVVVVDFWATWCGPCIREMPTMKRLYAEYKDKGVEFIGVSLDQPVEKGGLDKLRNYVASNGIEWPQYYQGNYWQSEFSMSWGVNAIPCVFLVDADGNLATTEAQGKLETLIPEYLEKARSKAAPKTADAH